MKEKHNGLIILIKVFIVLALIDMAVVAIVFPIICCFVEFDNEERAHLVYNILLFSCFGFGTAVFILMPICGKLLIRNKPHQVEFPCDNMPALWNGVQSMLTFRPSQHLFFYDRICICDRFLSGKCHLCRLLYHH